MAMSNTTFSVFTEIESQLQSLIEDGLTNKEEIIKLLEEGLNNFDWYDLGVSYAAGDAGSGWMKVSDIEYFRKMDGRDEILEDVEGWFQTHQFEHEVGTLLKKHFKEEYEKDDYEKIMEAKDDWAAGYMTYIIDKLEESVLEEV